MAQTSISFSLQSAENSFLAAIAGIFKGYGFEYDLIDIAGYSGFAFLNVINPIWTDPMVPTLHTGNVYVTPDVLIELWKEVIDQCSTLGIDFTVEWDPRQYEWENASNNVLEVGRAQSFFNKVCKHISEDKPVIVWGLPVPDYAIVVGYEGSDYVFSGVLGDNSTPYAKLNCVDIQAKGGFTAIYVGVKNGEAPSDRETLSFAAWMSKERDLSDRVLDIPSRESPYRLKELVTGSEAYAALAQILEDNDSELVFYGYLSYILSCWAERTELRKEFISRVASRHQGKTQHRHLRDVYTDFVHVNTQMQQLKSLFPETDFGDKKKISDDIAQTAAKLLDSCVEAESRATRAMEAAVFFWDD